MATYDNLPVYKVSYDLLLELFQIVNDFSRDHRFTIGEEMKKEMFAMIMFIYRANKNSEGRKKQIGEARERVETIRIMLRISHDLKQIGLEKFVSLSEKLESISKQLSLWEAKS